MQPQLRQMPPSNSRSTIAVFKPSCALRISSARIVLPAVEFQYEPCSKAREVGDVEVDGDLALELVATEAMRAENLPETMFCIGRLRTHRLRALAELGQSTPPLPAVA